MVNGMPPNLLAQYLCLWELTAVRQAVETAWISASVRRTFIELLVPAGSSSSRPTDDGRGAVVEAGMVVQGGRAGWSQCGSSYWRPGVKGRGVELGMAAGPG